VQVNYVIPWVSERESSGVRGLGVALLSVPKNFS